MRAQNAAAKPAVKALPAAEFLKTIPGAENIHPLVREYLVRNQASLSEVPLEMWKRASALFHHMSPGHPALQGSLTAFVKPAHAAGLLALQAVKCDEAKAYCVEQGQAVHPVVASFLDANPHCFVLLSPYGWREISILCKTASQQGQSALETQLLTRLPDKIVKELSRRAFSMRSAA